MIKTEERKKKFKMKSTTYRYKSDLVIFPLQDSPIFSFLRNLDLIFTFPGIFRLSAGLAMWCSVRTTKNGASIANEFQIDYVL